jgi:hypothetical protein
MKKYEAPEVVMLPSASAAIQAQAKFPNNVFDAMDKPTVGAYEADE